MLRNSRIVSHQDTRAELLLQTDYLFAGKAVQQLAVFNLFPLPPLDGGRIFVGILPKPAAIAVAGLEPFGLVVLIGVLIILPMLGAQLGSTSISSQVRLRLLRAQSSTRFFTSPGTSSSALSWGGAAGVSGALG
jgi:hypothetical protein